MQFHIQSIDCSPKLDFLYLVTEKLNNLDHFSDRILEYKVVLRVEKADKRDNKVVEVRVVIPGNDLFVKKTSESFEESLQKSYDVLQREIKDWKEKVS